MWTRLAYPFSTSLPPLNHHTSSHIYRYRYTEFLSYMLFTTSSRD